MEQSDPAFIENNICSIHDGIIRELIRIREELLASDQAKHVLALEALIDKTRQAKDKGIKIESRLKKYLYTIRALGFARDKENDAIEIIDNKINLTRMDAGC